MISADIGIILPMLPLVAFCNIELTGVTLPCMEFILQRGTTFVTCLHPQMIWAFQIGIYFSRKGFAPRVANPFLSELIPKDKETKN